MRVDFASKNAMRLWTSAIGSCHCQHRHNFLYSDIGHVPELVSWSLTSLFSTNMAISQTKGQGWKVIRTQ